MKKRVLSALLTLCMMLTMAPVTAFAADPDGSENNPFTSVSEYNTAVAGTTWDGQDVYLTISDTEFNSTSNPFNLTNVQSRVNPPKLHLTLTGCKFTGNTSGENAQTGNPSFMYLPNCQELKIDGCTFDSGSDTLTYGINWNLIQIQDATVSITNCTFNGEYEENAIKLNQRNGSDDTATDVKGNGAWTETEIIPASIASATISGCTFENPDKAIILLGSAGKNNGNAALSTGAFPVTITADNNGANVFLAYLASNTEASAAMGGDTEAIAKLVVSLSAGDTAKKTTNGDFAKDTDFVAKIGDDMYTSLQSAVDAVTPGEETTITLLGNASGDGVKIPSGNNIIFDLGGFTYTIDGETVGSTGTETNGFQLLKNSNITFKNGTITSEKAKILIQNYSNLTLDNVKLDGTKLNDTVPYTLSNNFGDITIKDSTIMAHDNGYAFDVYYWPSNGYTEGVSVTVEGDSKIEGNVQYGSDGTDSGKQNVAEKASLNITGGTFTGELSLGQIGTSTKAGISISGGTFQGNDTSNWTDYVQAGMKLDENGSVVIDTTTAVAKIGDVGYDTLQNAITAAKDGDTVTLLQDVVEDVTVAGKSITLDLNGKKITNKAGHTITVKIGANLPVEGSGTVDNVTHAKAAIWNEGTVNLNGGTYTRSKENGQSAESSGGNSYYVLLNHGTMTISDGVAVTQNGHFSSLLENGYYSYNSSNSSSGYVADTNAQNPTLTINGGTFDGGLNTVKNDDGGILIINGGTFKNVTQAALLNWNDTTINGGTFTSEAYCILNGGGNESIDKGDLAIKGGTFTAGDGYDAIAAMYGNDNYLEPDNIQVSGGTFSSDLSEDDFLTDDVKYKVAHRAGTFSYAKTLADAQKLAQSGDTITDLTATVDNTVTLTLDYNDGATDNVTYTVTTGTEVPLPTPSRTNYTFGGWKAADGTIYNAGNSYKVETDGVTLTAQWTYTGGSSGGGGGGGAATYSVSTPSSVANGTISVSPKSAAKDATVTVTVKPNTGYVLDTLTVKDADGKAISVTKKSATEYTFKMPASKVTISATFAAETVEPTSPFSDVATSAYYYDAVLWAVENDITNGTTATTFSPNADVSRAQMVTFLWRAAGSPKATGVNPFTDVKSSDYYYDAVLWAVANGVTNGTTETTFSPEKAVSRAQAVTFQWRAAGSPAASGNSFADVAADAYYADAVTWAVANEITNGMSATSFGPDVTVSRAQAVTFLYRAAN